MKSRNSDSFKTNGRIVIVGASLAGLRGAEALRKEGFTGHLTIIGDEPYEPYDRPPLSKQVQKGWVKADHTKLPRMRAIDAEWRLGVAATRLDRTKEVVQLANGDEVPGDALLIATGVRSSIPPVHGLRDAENVHGLHDLSDAKAIREKAANADNIVIIGAGLVGLDAAYAIVEMGKKPVIVEMADTILAANLDARAASVYMAKFEEAGCSFRLGRRVDGTECDASGAVTALTLDDGEQLPCSLVIAAAGVRPSIEFLKNSGVACEQGVTVNEYLAASAAGVYAAGDVTLLSGIWPNAVKQGEAAAMNMCGVPTVYGDAFALKNTVNFFGIVSLSVGRFTASDGDVEYCREARGGYEKVITRDGVPVGVILQGDISRSGFWQYLIKNKINIAAIRKPVRKISFADFYGFEANGEYKWAAPACNNPGFRS